MDFGANGSSDGFEAESLRLIRQKKMQSDRFDLLKNASNRNYRASINAAIVCFICIDFWASF